MTKETKNRYPTPLQYATLNYNVIPTRTIKSQLWWEADIYYAYKCTEHEQPQGSVNPSTLHNYPV